MIFRHGGAWVSIASSAEGAGDAAATAGRVHINNFGSPYRKRSPLPPRKRDWEVVSVSADIFIILNKKNQKNCGACRGEHFVPHFGRRESEWWKEEFFYYFIYHFMDGPTPSDPLSLHPIVFDQGSWECKAGFAGEMAPSKRVPSIVTECTPHASVVHPPPPPLFEVGHEAEERLRRMKQQGSLDQVKARRPVQHGMIINWDALEQVSKASVWCAQIYKFNPAYASCVLLRT